MTHSETNKTPWQAVGHGDINKSAPQDFDCNEKDLFRWAMG